MYHIEQHEEFDLPEPKIELDEDGELWRYTASVSQDTPKGTPLPPIEFGGRVIEIFAPCDLEAGSSYRVVPEDAVPETE